MAEVIAMRDKDMLGRLGENAAAHYLVSGGLTILDRNWRCPTGELDIIARQDRTLVVCEVKTRSTGRYGHPAEAVTEPKARRLRRLAARWLAAHHGGYDTVRIDILGLTVDPRGGFAIHHVRGVG
jgi:putative endonuclease